jgi:hypothetical protein
LNPHVWIAQYGNGQLALHHARGMRVPEYRSAALAGISPWLEQSNVILEEALSALEGTDYSGTRDIAVAKFSEALMKIESSTLSPILVRLIGMLSDTLRRNFAPELYLLTPPIAKIGGKNAAEAVFHAIRRVCQWWP